MDSYQRRLLTLVSVFVSAFLLYLYMRLESIRSDWTDSRRFYSGEQCSFYSGEVIEARKRWKGNFPIMITYSANGNLKSQAELIYNSGYDHNNFHTLKNINLCGENGATCITADFRLFLDEYFREISGSFFKKDESQTTYFIPPDAEIQPSDFQTYQIFGGMFALALLTDAHIDMYFLKFNWREPSRILDCIYELRYIDSEQYQIYSEISDKRYTYYYNGDAANFTQFSLGPSPKPFQRETMDSSNLYSARYYPFGEAAERILIEPYKLSREAIHEGSMKYLGVKCTEIPNFFHDRRSSFYGLNTKVLLLLWRDNSICPSYPRCLKFWRAMSMLTKDELYQVYKVITGYHSFPFSSGGFSRFPKTLIVFEDGHDLFPRRFKINLYYNFTVNEMYENLKNY